MIVSYREAQAVILGGACPKIKCPVGLKQGPGWISLCK